MSVIPGRFFWVRLGTKSFLFGYLRNKKRETTKVVSIISAQEPDFLKVMMCLPVSAGRGARSSNLRFKKTSAKGKNYAFPVKNFKCIIPCKLTIGFLNLKNFTNLVFSNVYFTLDTQYKHIRSFIVPNKLRLFLISNAFSSKWMVNLWY